MSLTRKEVEHVATLSRLALSDEELQRMTDELGATLQYVEKINELDTSAVEPMAHALSEENVFRPDEAAEGLSRDEALANAPAQKDGYFKVPRIIE